MKLKDIQAANGPEVRFQWVPAHSKVEGIERTNALARSVTAKQVTTPSPDTFNTGIVVSHAVKRVKNLGQRTIGQRHIQWQKGASTLGTWTERFQACTRGPYTTISSALKRQFYP